MQSVAFIRLLSAHVDKDTNAWFPSVLTMRVFFAIMHLFLSAVHSHLSSTYVRLVQVEYLIELRKIEAKKVAPAAWMQVLQGENN